MKKSVLFIACATLFVVVSVLNGKFAKAQEVSTSVCSEIATDPTHPVYGACEAAGYFR